MPEENKNSFNWWPWIIIMVATLLIFVVLVTLCSCWPWWIALILTLDLFLLLAVNYMNKMRQKVGWLFSLLLIISPVVILLFVGGFTWWMWVLVVGLYLLTLIFYFIGILSENYWTVSVPASLMLLLMVLILQVSL